MKFVEKFCDKLGKSLFLISGQVYDTLLQYSWPGNIRELEHVIERCVLLTAGTSIEVVHLPLPQKSMSSSTETIGQFVVTTIDENDRAYILKVLKHIKGQISGEGGAAELLGIPPSTLNSRMKKLGIRKEHFG